MPLKIGIIAHIRHDIGEPFAGGLEVHTAQLARGFSDLGHDVTVFGAAAADGGDCFVEKFCDETNTLFASNEDSFAYEHHAYFKLMQTLQHSAFDIIHNNSLHYLPVAMAGILPMPVVTTLHTPPFWELAGTIQLCSAGSRSFVAVSSSVAKAWSAVTTVNRVILNGVDLKKFQFNEQTDAEPYVIWTGRIVPEKGLHLAIDAARLAGVKLVFAGPISDKQYYNAEILPRLTAQTRYIGHVDHDVLIRWVAGATACLCTPGWEEPYGLVVAEALACGTPVAAFARGALPSLLDASSGILVAPGDVSALAAAVIQAQFLSRADCRRRAEQIGDVQNMLRDYEEFYRHLIGQEKHVRYQNKFDIAHPVDRPALMEYYLNHLPPDFAAAA